MRVDRNNILKRSDNVIFRKIEGEYVLVPTTKSSEDTEFIFNLNEVGGDVWEKIDGRKTLNDIIAELISEYDGNSENIEKQVIEFINGIKEARLVEIV
mgnify:CR=1 FL=1